MSYAEAQELAGFNASMRHAIVEAIGTDTVTPTELVKRINPYGLLIPGLPSAIWDLVSEGVLLWNSDRTLTLAFKS